MKFTQTGTFKKNTLEELVAIKPIERIEEILLDKLDYLVGFVAQEKSEIINDYVKNLIKKYQGLVEKGFSKNSFGEFEKYYQNSRI